MTRIGTFILDNGRNDGSVFESYFECEEAREDDERVFGRDPLRQFTPIKEMPSGGPSPWCAGNWAKNARFPLGISVSRPNRLKRPSRLKQHTKNARPPR